MSIVDENDPMEMKKKYMTDYEKYAIENQDVSVTKPRWKSFHFSNAGDIE